MPFRFQLVNDASDRSIPLLTYAICLWYLCPRLSAAISLWQIRSVSEWCSPPLTDSICIWMIQSASDSCIQSQSDAWCSPPLPDAICLWIFQPDFSDWCIPLLTDAFRFRSMQFASYFWQMQLRFLMVHSVSGRCKFRFWMTYSVSVRCIPPLTHHSITHQFIV